MLEAIEASASEDPDRSADGYEDLVQLSLELHGALEAGEDPSLDWPYWNAVLAVVQGEGFPDEVDAGALARSAIPRVPDAYRAAAAERCAHDLYARCDLQGAYACIELGLQAQPEVPIRSGFLTFRAQLQRREGRWEAGLASVEAALAVLESSEGSRADRARGYALGERTANLAGQGARRRAAAALEEEVAFARASGLPDLEALALEQQIDGWLSTGSYQEAFLSARRRLDDASASAAPGARARLHAMGGRAVLELARSASAQRDELHTLAEEWFLNALEDDAALGVLEAFRVELDLVECAMSRSDLDEARGRLGRCALRSVPCGEDLAALEFGAFRTALEVRVALRGGVDAERMGELAERSRQGFEALLSAWDETGSESGLQFLGSNTRREILGAQIDLSCRSGNEAAALESLLRVQARGSLARRGALAAPNIEEVRAGLLGEGQGLLVYAPAPWGGRVFALDDEGLSSAALAPEPELWSSCRALRSLLDRAVTSEEQDPELEALLATHRSEVSAQLLGDAVAARVATWSGLTVVGSEYFFGLPFECLRDPADPERWLGESKAVDELPSVPLGLQLAGRESPELEAGLTLLVASNPAPELRRAHGELEPFQPTDPELARLSEAFGERTEVVTGVTAGRLRAGVERGAAVTHILTHGVYEHSVQAAGPALALEPSEDGPALFRCRDVRQLRASGVILLSACMAGKGSAPWGDDRVADLGGAFLEAGASAVIQTGRRLRYAQALEFMGFVTRELAKGAAPAEAARRARAGLGGGELARARWALIQVIGLGGS